MRNKTTSQTDDKLVMSFSTKQALINLRYVPGIVIEASIALRLLSNYRDSVVVWLAYLLIAASVVGTIAGL